MDAAAAASLLLPCPHCGAGNRVPNGRLDDRPNCGRCHEPLFLRAPIALTEATFARHANAGIPLLVDFWAAWCGPCRNMAPHFEAAAAQLEPRVRLGKVDTEAEPSLSAQFAIRSIPTLVLIYGGREIGRQSGAMATQQIVQWVEGVGAR
jgi:thioredoxin 2